MLYRRIRMGVNVPKFVLFEPNLVGWEEGFEYAIRDVESLVVPLAVKTEALKKEVLKIFLWGI